jgi:uncharacterized protein YunC (DUF1805 family)
MIETEILELERGAVLAMKIELGEKAPLLLAKAENGYIACGYFNEKTVEKLDDCAAIVTGVKGFDDLLEARLEYVSPKAKERGLKKGMSAKQALEFLI